MGSLTKGKSLQGESKILHEKAFERFNIGTSCLETIANFIEDRTSVEELLSRRYKSLADDLTNILEQNSDFEYGATREVWCEFVSQLLCRADIHAKITVELARENGPLDAIQGYLCPSVQTRMMELVRRYSETRQAQRQVLSAVKEAKVCYHAHCRHYADLDSEQNVMRRGGETCPRYLQTRHRLDRQKGQVARARDHYLSALLGEEQARPHYLQKMQGLKVEFDQLERERVMQVRAAFLDTLAALDSHNKRDERRHVLKTLQQKVQCIDVEAEVEKFDNMFLEEIPDIELEEYAGQEIEDVDDPSSDEDLEEEDDKFVHDLHTRPASSIRRDQSVYEAMLVSRNSETTSGENEEQGACDDVPEEDDQEETEVSSSIKKELSDTCLTKKQTACAETSKGDLKLDLPASPREAFCHDEEIEGRIMKPEQEVTSTAKMSNVKVRAISNYRGRTSSELSFRIGQSIKQKSIADAMGMAYGWTRKARTGKKKYGYFPVALVELKPPKEKRRNILF